MNQARARFAILVVLSLGGCQVQTDWVAAVARDAQCSDPNDCGTRIQCGDAGGCDAGIQCADGADCGSGAQCPDAGDCGVSPRCADAADCDSGAQCADASDCGTQLPACAPRTCAPQAGSTCPLADRLVELGDSCEPPDAGPLRFRYAICTCENLVTEFPLHVDGPGPADVAVNGAMQVGADVRIAGSLQVTGALDTSGYVATVVGPVTQQANARCACEDANLLDVAAIAAQRAGDNDNASQPEGSLELNGFFGARELDLQCGRYYFPRIAGDSALDIRVHGNAALYVEGNVELDDELRIEADPAVSAWLFVGGTVRVSGVTALTASSDAHVDLLVGGAGTVQLDSTASVDGNVYAPRAVLSTRAPMDVKGSVFVWRVAPGGVLTVTAPERAAASCETP